MLLSLVPQKTISNPAPVIDFVVKDPFTLFALCGKAPNASVREFYRGVQVYNSRQFPQKLYGYVLFKIASTQCGHQATC